jgi:hypothetical protein
MIDYSKIKPDVLGALKRYVEQRIETGGFLRAVLENNLQEAMGRADEANREAIFHICAYVYNEIPSACHGSPKRVAEWLKPPIRAVVGVYREDNPQDVDEAYGAGTYERLFPSEV